MLTLLKQIEHRSNGYFTPTVTVLVAVNTLFFLIAFISELQNSTAALEWLALHGDTITRMYLWQIVTAAFLHADPFHFLINMFVFVLFARHIVHSRLGRSGLWWLVIGAVLLGSLTWVLIQSLRSGPAAALGFSGVTNAVIVAFAVLYPQARIFFLPAWVLVSAFVLLDLLYAIQGSTNTAHEIHLAGAAYGFLLTWFQPRLAPWWQARRRQGQRQRENARAQRRSEQDADIDALLQKVSEQGLSALDARERQRLEAYSKKRRQEMRR